MNDALHSDPNNIMDFLSMPMNSPAASNTSFVSEVTMYSIENLNILRLQHRNFWVCCPEKI